MGEEAPTPLSQLPDPHRKLLPPHRPKQTGRHAWVLTRGQGFCLLLFLRILTNPDKDLEERQEREGVR